METAVQFFEEAVTLIVMAVFLLFFYLVILAPWLLVVWLAARGTRALLAPRPRFLLLSSLAAAGVAPFFGSHASMFPMYWKFLGMNTNPPGDPISDLESILVTWGLFLLVGFGISRYRASRAQTLPKKEIEE